MEKILVYIGDSFTFSAITDYEWLIKKNIIDEKNISYIKYLNYLFFYNKKNNLNSIYKISEKTRIENSWSHRLSNLLKIKYINISVPGASWQGLVNQVIYSLLNIKNKKIIFIIGCPINERILLEIKDREKFLNKDFFLSEEKNISKEFDVLDLYGFDKTNQNEYLLNVHSFWNKKFSNSITYSNKNVDETLSTFFTEKIFSLYNLHAIMNIISLIKDNDFFFLPTWHETVETAFSDIVKDEDILNMFLLNKIPKYQLSLKSPFTLKNVKTTKYSPHPSFESQEIIASYYYDFLKNKI